MILDRGLRKLLIDDKIGPALCTAPKKLETNWGFSYAENRKIDYNKRALEFFVFGNGNRYHYLHYKKYGKPT